MPVRCAAAVLLGLAAAAVRAEVPAASEPIEDGGTLEEVVVTGEFPGPGMWKVFRDGDDAGHVLWIVGEPGPLPRRLQWKSSDVEAVLLRSQEVLLDAALRVEPDEKIGVFRGLSLLPSALKARRDPEGATLRERLPPDLYARWQAHKKRYLGSDAGVERWRPIFAADKLRREAIDDLGLRARGMVWEEVEKLAKKEQKKVTTPSLRFTFEADQLKARIREFSRERLTDTECFRVTLDLVDALADRVIEEQRARAWATADLGTLDRLPPLPNPMLPCSMVLLGSQVAQDLLPADIRAQLEALWIDSAASALAANQTTLAIVPLAKLTREEGYLARLRARGFTIDPPK
jgi:hypothetical protein